MSNILFGRTQSALQTPFDATDAEAIAAGISSTDAFHAICEAKNDAISNDRFFLLSSYGGNANVGRYLEFFPNIDSSIAPIFMAASTRAIQAVLESTAASTGTVGFFDLNVSSVTPVYSISLTAATRNVQLGTPYLFTFAASAQIALRVTSGSINQPRCYFVLNTNT